MEFKITTDLATVRDQQIDANFAEVEAWLDAELKPYVGLVVTADAIPSAKTYRANLRKVKERIEDYRKEAKKAALAPYTVFEEKAKILTGKIDKAVENIDGQVKDFERREAEAKVASLREYYDSVVDDEIREYLPWDVLYNQKWTNKTCSAEYAKAEIYARISTVKSDLDAIRQMGGEDTAYLLGYYQETLDLSAVIKKQTDLKTRRQRIQQQVREEEERRKAAEQGEELMSAIKQAAAESVASILENEAVVTIDFRVTCTKGQLAALGRWLKDNGIEYGRVPK